MGIYVYAFTHAAPEPSGADPSYPGLEGLDGAPVHRISGRRVGAFVSAFPRTKVRPRRRHLLAHDRTIRALMDQGPVLPTSFGTLAAGRADLVELLDRHGDAIAADLDRVGERVEMAARARIAADNLFERFVSTHEPLRRARDRMLADGQGRDRQSMLEVGKLFEGLLEAERERVRLAFVHGVESTEHEVRSHPPKNEAQVFDLAFLIPRNGVEPWEKAVEAVAAELEDDLVIDLAGPLPPYSFSELRLGLADA